MPQGHRDDQREEIDEAKRTFDRRLIAQNAAEKKMTDAKQEWAEASIALMESFFHLRTLIQEDPTS